MRRLAAPLGDAERYVVEHRQMLEEGVDLEGAPQAALDALRLAHPRHVLAAEEDAPRARRQGAQQHVDEGRLARAVGADERVAVSGMQPEVDVLRDGQRAEALAELAGLKNDNHLSRRPRIPPGANMTTNTRMKPMPKYQYSGNCLAR